MKLKGKIALVCGATGGIGSEIVKALDKEGVDCILVARKLKKLKLLTQSLSGRNHKYYSADFANSDDIIRVSRKIKNDYEKLDLVFNYSGIGIYKNIEDLTLKDWEDSLMVNTTSHLILVQELLPLLRKAEDPVVVAPGSGAGKIPTAGRAAYNVSKFALRGLSLSLSKEYVGQKPKFVLITLGSVLTGFGQGIKKRKKLQEKGKAYLDPVWVGSKIVRVIKNGKLEPEVSIYPSHYFDEMKKGKRQK